MTVYLYNNKSDTKVLNKDYESVLNDPVTATARGAVDIDKPVLLLNCSAINFNYFKITEFGRYYNVTSRSLVPGGHMLVSGESDPLESFASGIGNLECLIVRAEDPEMRERYFTDQCIPIPADPQYEVIEGEEIISSLSSGMYVIGVV